MNIIIRLKNNYAKILWGISMNGRKHMAENVTVIQKQRVIKDYAVWIYDRVSTSHKAPMDSLQAQIQGLTRLAVAHRTWFVADVFIDAAYAKTGSKRSEINRMINECKYGNLDIILIKSFSRFGRDAKEGLEAIRRIRVAGKRIIFEKDKIDTETVKDELLISTIETCEMTGEAKIYAWA